MKAYLDTTVLTLLLFGQSHQPQRHAEVTAFFEALDAGRLQAVVSIYALQELCTYCYANFPSEHAPVVTRLAFHEALGHEVLVVPLLTRMDRIVLSRRFPMHDPSDQAHVATAYREGCDVIVTYDEHYQEIADRFACLTAGEVLTRLTEEASPRIYPQEGPSEGE
jgi:predicted nucleic acid-binding protein